MSVINRMLQELDARGAAQPARPPVMPQRRASARRPGSWRLWAAAAAALLAWGAAQHIRPNAIQHGWQQVVRNVQSFWPERERVASAQAPTPPAATTLAAVTLATAPQVFEPGATGQAVIREMSMDLSLSAASHPPRAARLPVARAAVAQRAASAVVKAVPADAAPAPVATVADTQAQRFTMIDPPAAGAASSTVARAAAAHRHALDLAEEGRETAALEAALDVLRIEPRHLAAHRLAAALAINLNRFEQAEALIQAGLGLQPGDAELNTLRARSLAASGQGDAALAALQELQRPNADALGLKAGLLARDGHYPQAARTYELALREQPGNATWWLGLGVALDAQGQTQPARQAFARAHALGTLRPDLQGWVEQKMATQR